MGVVEVVVYAFELEERFPDNSKRGHIYSGTNPPCFCFA